MRPHRRQPTRLPRPWDSPGKNTGVGCHFLLQCMKVKSESEVAQSCLTPSDPMDCSLPGSSIHGIFQARVLEWGAIAFSKRTILEFTKEDISVTYQFSSVAQSCPILCDPMACSPPGPWNSLGKNTRVGCYSLQGIFQTQELNLGPLQYSCLENPMEGGAW